MSGALSYLHVAFSSVVALIVVKVVPSGSSMVGDPFDTTGGVVSGGGVGVGEGVGVGSGALIVKPSEKLPFVTPT